MLDKILLSEISPAKAAELLEVFVDDFIAATNDTPIKTLLNLSRAMLNNIHYIFPQPDVSGNDGYDPISESKIDKGAEVW
eukprot:9274861-Ditylum_brightwellii.AAC.1